MKEYLEGFSWAGAADCEKPVRTDLNAAFKVMNLGSEFTYDSQESPANFAVFWILLKKEKKKKRRVEKSWKDARDLEVVRLQIQGNAVSRFCDVPLTDRALIGESYPHPGRLGNSSSTFSPCRMQMGGFRHLPPQ